MSGRGRNMPRKGLEYICDACGKGMGKRHKQNHRISSLESCLKCKVCKKSFSMGFADKKIKPHKKESYSCKICKKEFKFECLLTYHLFEHSNDWPCWCSVCKKGFALPSHLKKHMRYHDEPQFKCSACPLMFKSKESLKAHGTFHSSACKWKCNECSKGFLFESDMEKHMRTHDIDRKYECSVCGFEAKSKHNLDKHSLFHTKEYTENFKLKCEVCSKGFSYQSELKQHMSKHNNDRNFRCILCSSEFKHKSELLKHKLIHSGQYKWKCDSCSKGFVFQSELKAHMRFHDESRQYQCGICLLKFTNKTELTKHSQIHAGQYKYKCGVCSKLFPNKVNLGKHLQTHSENLVFHTNNTSEDFEEAIDDPQSGAQSLKCDLCNCECVSDLLLQQHKQIYHQTAMVILTHPDSDTHARSSNLVFDTSDIPADSEQIVQNFNTEYIGCTETHSVKCDFCSYECDSESALGQHKQLCHQTVMVLLTHSDGDVDSQSNLVIHTNDINSEEAADDPDSEHHGGNLPFKCDLCIYECVSELLLEQHKQLCHQTVMVLLTPSDHDMNSQSDFVIHTNDILINSEEVADDPVSEHDGMLSFKCDLCNYECDSELLLGQHKQLCHQTVMVLLTHSDGDMDSQSDLVMHTNDTLINSEEPADDPNAEHGGMLLFKCDLCNYECDSELLLGQHKQLHHQTVMVLLTHSDGDMDSQSDLVFHTNDILVNSEDVDYPYSEYTGYTGTQSLKCDLCKYECESELLLSQHKQHYHQTILTTVTNPNSHVPTQSVIISETNEILLGTEGASDDSNSKYTGTQSLKCDFCSYECDSELLLGQHKEVDHQTILTIVANPDSDKRSESNDLNFGNNEILSNPEETVDNSTSEYSGIEFFKCELCNHQCESELLLGQHKQLYHQTVMVLLTHPDKDMNVQSANLVFHTNDILANSEEANEFVPNSECIGHTGTHLLKCDLCSYECDSESTLAQHKQVYHHTILAIATNPSSDMDTESGNIVFGTHNVLKNSEEVIDGPNFEHTETQSFKCDLCKFECDCESVLGHHRQVNHQKILPNETNADNDMQTQSGDLVSRTNAVFVNIEEIAEDPNSEYTGARSFSCDLCSYECDSELLLGHHKQVCHQTILAIATNPNSDMDTESGDIVFGTHNVLKNSEEVIDGPNFEHTETQSFKCDLCKFECDCESVLGHHRQVNHQKILPNETNADNDMQTQSGDLVSRTNAVFVNIEEIVEDPNSEYTGARSFSCDLCSYECDSELLLGHHKQVCHQTILTIATNPDSDMQTPSRGLVSGINDIFLNTEKAIDYPNLEYTGHTVTESFKCDLCSLCSYECDSESSLGQHTEVYHQTILTIVTNPENGIHPQSGMESNEILTNSKEAIDDLNLVCIGTQSFKCNLCNYEFDSELVLEQHKQVYHRNILTIVTNPDNDTYSQLENFVFEVNDIPMNSEDANYDPTLQYTEAQSFKCDLCNYECDSELLLEQHKQVYHQTILTIVTNQDNDMQPQSGNLVLGTYEIIPNFEEAVDNPDSEYNGYVEVDSFKCDLCGYECNSELLLEQHRQVYHQTFLAIVTNPDSDMPVSSADVIFQTEGNLANFDEAVENPNSLRTGAESVKCDLCPYECDSELLLEQHKQVYHQTIMTIVTNTDNDMHTESGNLVSQSNDNRLNSEVAVCGPPPECNGNQSLKCDLCRYECDSELLLEQHKQLYHPTIMVLLTHPDNDMQPQSGDLVLGTYEIIPNFEEAVDDPNSEFTRCTEAESFKCGLCGYECQSELLLGQHKQEYHQTFLTILTSPESNMPIQPGAIVFQTNDIISTNSEEQS